VYNLKEIGEFLKASRMSNGVSVEEAAEDLNFSTLQIENIEEGNIRAFKDVYALRELVKEYAKYLGVETDSIVDEFNDFMFEHTSKISLDDILEARKLLKEKDKEEEKPKVVSPYTNIRTSKFKFDRIKLKPLLISIGIIILILITIFIWLKVQNQESIVSSELMRNNKEEVYEFTN
jgi:cytoskeletal protein RodZ